MKPESETRNDESASTNDRSSATIPPTQDKRSARRDECHGENGCAHKRENVANSPPQEVLKRKRSG